MNLMAIGNGVMCLACGAPMAIWPARRRRIAVAKWRARLAELEGGAPESYFEEHRALLAYPPHRTDMRTRAAGIVATLCGLALIALAFRA